MTNSTSNLTPTVRSVYSFRTRPYSNSKFASRTTDRFAALKVIGVNEEYVVIAVLDSIWINPPSIEDVRSRAILRQHRFAHTGRPAVWGVNADWWNTSDLSEMTLVGIASLSLEEAQSASNILEHVPGSAFSTVGFANYAAEGEWRWANDREAFVAEQAAIEAEESAKRAAEAERLRGRLRGLTWEQLLNETPFERWVPSPPFPPVEFTLEAREKIHASCRELRSLGNKPRKPAVRKILRECVEWFNMADEKAGGVVETEEREDICKVLEEMAYVARQRSLVEEINGWRTW